MECVFCTLLGGNEMNKYTLNEKFFDIIDTEEKAYILGFIFADGNVSDSSKDKHYRLRVTLKHEDADILAKIKSSLDFTGRIHNRELKSKQRDTSGYKISELSISNKYLITRLVSLGVVPNKTLIIQYPTLPKHLHRHFIRGFFDGDGSIYLRKDRKNGINFELSCASRDFITEVAKIIQNETGVEVRVYAKPTKVQMSLIKVSQNKARLILDWMYADSNIYLDRKYLMYKELVAPLVSNS